MLEVIRTSAEIRTCLTVVISASTVLCVIYLVEGLSKSTRVASMLSKSFIGRKLRNLKAKRNQVLKKEMLNNAN